MYISIIAILIYMVILIVSGPLNLELHLIRLFGEIKAKGVPQTLTVINAQPGLSNSFPGHNVRPVIFLLTSLPTGTWSACLHPPKIL
jgi:hypothetical protein